MARLSIVVPIYNVEQTLNRCIDSLINQTLKNIDIILVDDGSTDGSSVIAKQYSENFPNQIKYIRKDNGGLSSARNYGMEYVETEFVGFIDSDDYADLELYESMLKAVNDSTKIVECDFIWEYDKKQKFDISPQYRTISDYMVRGRVVAWNKIYKVDWLKETEVEFPEGLLYEDLNFFFKLLPHLKKIEEVIVVKNRYIHYVQHEGTITSEHSLKLLQILESYSGVFEYYKSNNIFDLYRDELEYKFCRNIFCSFSIKALKVKGIKNRKIIFSKFWESVTNNFPNWKSNKYIKQSGLSNIYLKSMNKVFYYALRYI